MRILAILESQLSLTNVNSLHGRWETFSAICSLQPAFHPSVCQLLERFMVIRSGSAAFELENVHLIFFILGEKKFLFVR